MEFEKKLNFSHWSTEFHIKATQQMNVWCRIGYLGFRQNNLISALITSSRDPQEPNLLHRDIFFIKVESHLTTVRLFVPI